MGWLSGAEKVNKTNAWHLWSRRAANLNFHLTKLVNGLSLIRRYNCGKCCAALFLPTRTCYCYYCWQLAAGFGRLAFCVAADDDERSRAYTTTKGSSLSQPVSLAARGSRGRPAQFRPVSVVAQWSMATLFLLTHRLCIHVAYFPACPPPPAPPPPRLAFTSCA